MNKKLVLVIALIPLNFISIFFTIAQLSHNYTYAWRGVSIVAGISIVMAMVILPFVLPKKPS